MLTCGILINIAYTANNIKLYSKIASLFLVYGIVITWWKCSINNSETSLVLHYDHYHTEHLWASDKDSFNG